MKNKVNKKADQKTKTVVTYRDHADLTSLLSEIASRGLKVAPFSMIGNGSEQQAFVCKHPEEKDVICFWTGTEFIQNTYFPAWTEVLVLTDPFAC